MTRFTFTPVPGMVYFIGAGPGAADLITVRGRDIIAQADLILYADSLVEESVAYLARKPEAQVVGSSGLHLEQISTLMVGTAQRGGVVARVHSGDPALYGAIYEQMAYLDDHAIPYDIVPGVTAAFAVAARLKTELTIPDLVQTIILTRTAGRTPMPAREDLRTLAAPGASLAIYLSTSHIRQVVDDLLASGGYQPDTPVAVVHKVTWPDESYVLGTLADIVEKVREAGYTKQALILVSPALEVTLKSPQRRTGSRLYDRSYTHGFRRAEATADSRQPTADSQNLTSAASGQPPAVVIAVTRRGSQLAARLAAELGANLAIPTKFAQVISNGTQSVKSSNPNLQPSNLPTLRAEPQDEAFQPSTFNFQPPTPSLYPDSALAEVRRRWPAYRQLILVMPAGVAIRAIAPLLSHKAGDPAVICLDEAGRSVIPLLGGHRAGANELARRIANITGGYTAVTTASDVQGKPALDLPPSNESGTGAKPWFIDPTSALTHTSGCLVNDEPIGVYIDPALATARQQAFDWLGTADNLVWVNSLDELDVDAYTAGVIVSHRTLSDQRQHLLQKSILYHPPILVVGMGCKQGVPASELREALATTLADNNLAWESITALATVDLKADEPGLHELAAELAVPLQIVGRAQLTSLEAVGFSPSAAQEKLDLPGVAEPCALVVSGGELIVSKRSFARCTVAIALRG